jgi:hypothetical protein
MFTKIITASVFTFIGLCAQAEILKCTAEDMLNNPNVSSAIDSQIENMLNNVGIELVDDSIEKTIHLRDYNNPYLEIKMKTKRGSILSANSSQRLIISIYSQTDNEGIPSSRYCMLAYVGAALWNETWNTGVKIDGDSNFFSLRIYEPMPITN